MSGSLDNCSLCLSTINGSNHDELSQIVEAYHSETHWFSTRTLVILILAYTLVVVLGVVGNTLVCVVVFVRKDLRNSRNLYILNLSVCDLIMCSVCLPFSLVKYTVKRWTLGAIMCSIVPALATVDVFVSTFTIIAIAVDRYKAIVHASRDHSQSMQVLYVLIVIWILSVALASPLFIFHKLSSDFVLGKSVFHTCIEVWPEDLFRKIYTTFVAVIQYLAPTVVISVLHARICSFLRTRIHESASRPSDVQRCERGLSRHRKNIMLLSALAVTFSLTWLPLTVLNVTADWTPDNSVFGMFDEEQFYLTHAICLLIAMSSAAINPVLYGWFNGNFRRAFVEVLCTGTKDLRENTRLKRDVNQENVNPYNSFQRTPSSVK